MPSEIVPSWNASDRSAMAYSSRPTSMLPGGGLRQPASQPSSALTTRIAAKKAELENLRQLRDLSRTLATQMQALENKIATLKDGTEAVACVLANWDNVLRAISLASNKAGGLREATGPENEAPPTEPRLPATLVRIPAEPREKTGE
ncbi:DASH complex subunit DAD2 [Penicillium macrosclerotiorum]|uniref:DASH complex subunit DAD2 n=1 Tax=Penicillium macrosclerotiorum TaxID=303699 RepID=UPI00254881FE|nr:DASH complex subunit DAD2 [Penicillium macrosclerotiorum]KAJ5689773.1 DASH complex subunit DAD2 [Penicillium macrosclerotiorum]